MKSKKEKQDFPKLNKWEQLVIDYLTGWGKGIDSSNFSIAKKSLVNKGVFEVGPNNLIVPTALCLRMISQQDREYILENAKNFESGSFKHEKFMLAFNYRLAGFKELADEHINFILEDCGPEAWETVVITLGTFEKYKEIVEEYDNAIENG